LTILLIVGVTTTYYRLEAGFHQALSAKSPVRAEVKARAPFVI